MNIQAFKGILARFELVEEDVSNITVGEKNLLQMFVGKDYVSFTEYCGTIIGFINLQKKGLITALSETDYTPTKKGSQVISFLAYLEKLDEVSKSPIYENGV